MWTRRALPGLLLAAGAVAAALSSAPVEAAGPVTLRPPIRITTPGESRCPAEGEPDVVVTRAGTWVGYNDDHECLVPVVSEMRLTGLQLIPAKGGPPKFVPLRPMAPGHVFYGDPALAPDPHGDGVILATLYDGGKGITIEVFRISPAFKVTHLPKPAVHASASDDKEFVGTDTSRRSRWFGRTYVAWDDFVTGELVIQAYDRKWLPRVRISDSVGKPDVAVAADGTVAVAYEVADGVAVRISKNGGATFRAPVLALPGGEPGRNDPSCPLRPTVGTRQRATKAVRATYDALGRLHVVAALSPAALPSAGVVTGGESTVVHGVSADGATWQVATVGESEAVRFHPAIAPTPAGGVAVAWLEVTATASTQYDAYLAVAPRGSARFGSPVRLSTAAATFPSAMEAMLNANCYGIGDYIGLATTSRGVVATWPTTDATTTPQVDSDVLVREAVLR